MKKNNSVLKKPEWLKIKIPDAISYSKIKTSLNKGNLHTICESGKCPNQGECWNRGTATFMILGDRCTRSCKFCAVNHEKPLPVDTEEPVALAQTVKDFNLKHCVLTSVDRDDLEDKGVTHWISCINEVKKLNPNITIEALLPDFMGDKELIRRVCEAEMDVFAHNMETVRRLSTEIRSANNYDRSLQVLALAAEFGMRTKSGIMLGLGEEEKEIIEVMDDLLKVNCKILTIGQYLQPTSKHWPVKAYIEPKDFLRYRKIGLEKGFEMVESAPLVRSSYHAEKHV